MAQTPEFSGSYRGWVVGGLIIVAILVISAALWFHYHP